MFQSAGVVGGGRQGCAIVGTLGGQRRLGPWCVVSGWCDVEKYTRADSAQQMLFETSHRIISVV